MGSAFFYSDNKCLTESHILDSGKKKKGKWNFEENFKEKS